MPCRSYDYDDYSSSASTTEILKLKKLSDKLARIACKAMDELVKQGKADFLLLKDKEVRTWYEQHVKDDLKAKAEAEEKRLILEAARLEKERKAKIREDALSKLTAEERELLEKIKQLPNFQPQPGHSEKTFFEKMRDYFQVR